ncbi:MAG: gliding motility-associated C-terminal domain-containing protein [Fimbriimonadaceae bacterium]|nr:gliding motility-associated C-terminal domain-containing protein [Chitinophagales bacterium]
MKKLLFVLFSSCILLPSFANQAKTGDLQFIQNNGQWNNKVELKADVYGGTLFLEKNCLTWNFSTISEVTQHTDHPNTSNTNNTVKGHAFKTYFLHANNNVQIAGTEKYSNYYNYFVGDDETRWKGNVPAFAKVLYENLYENIDATVYSSDGNIKYDFIIKPNADVSKIQLQYEGLNAIQIVNGNLELITSINKIIELKPYAYQQYGDYKIEVICYYKLNGNIISFEFPNGYDVNTELIIDPATLIFASYSGSTADNWGYTATYDADGNLYGAGIVFGTGYPTTTGAYEEEFVGGTGFFACDVGISKFTPDGTDLIYSTYLGGTKNELPHSLVVDSADQLIVYGTTASDDFPTPTGTYDDTFGGGDNITVTSVVEFASGSDVFVTKINAAGDAIIGSTYIGGSENDGLNIGETGYNYGDHARGEVVVDIFGNCYIASCTKSSDLPTTSGVVQTDIAGDQDGFVAKLNNDLSILTWCTYIGGGDNDGVYSIKKAVSDEFIVCGGTESDDFPTLPSALNPDYLGGDVDGFVCRLSGDATSFIGSTFIGTDQYDQTYFVEVDDEDNVYVTGQTKGAYPVTAGVYTNPNSSQYITKLNNDLTSIIYSTVFGTGSSNVNLVPSAFLVDNCKNVYFSGWGGSINVSYGSGFGNTMGYTTDLPVTGDAFQSSTDGSDYYFIAFEKDAGDLIYATFFGGSSTQEHVDGGTSRFDKKGRIYQAVCAGCGSSDAFPTTDGVWSEDNGSSNCNLGVIKFEFNFIGPNADFVITPEFEGCEPFTVEFDNNSEFADFFDWDFGDGGSSDLEEPTHTYTEPGTYTVLLIASDPEACDPVDSAIAIVEVYENPQVDFTIGPDSVNIYSFATFSDFSEGAVSWYWTFGDGSSSTSQNPTHQYLQEGNYTVCLTVVNEFGCSDSACFPIEVFAYSLLDVPNAFSPNGDGYNDFYSPVLFSMVSFELSIYNRWGELVFYTTDPELEWDGTYNGKEQEMDTYVYIVNGEGDDGKKYFDKGNITLVR